MTDHSVEENASESEHSEDDTTNNATISRTRTYLIAGTVGLANICWGIMDSLPGAFYPNEAESKGANPSEYGFVFGIIHLASFAASPVFARYGSTIGLNPMLWIGTVLEPMANFGLGLLDLLDDKWTFLVLSYVFRCIGGVCVTATWIAAIAILMKLFPNHTGTIFAATETVFGIGLMLGPGFGALLFSWHGYMTPFLVSGSMALLAGFSMMCILPKVESDGSRSNAGSARLQLSSIFKSGSLFMPYAIVFVNALGISFIEAMLETHMFHTLKVDEVQVGIVFIIDATVYTILTLIVGKVCDKYGYLNVTSNIGQITSIVFFLLIGPMPGLGFNQTLVLIRILGAVNGLGSAFLMVTSFSRAFSNALEAGYEDNTDTSTMVSGMWQGFFYLGNFLGSTGGGILVHTLGFPWTSTILAGLFLTLLILDSLLMLKQKCIQEISYDQLDDRSC